MLRTRKIAGEIARWRYSPEQKERTHLKPTTYLLVLTYLSTLQHRCLANALNGKTKG